MRFASIAALLLCTALKCAASNYCLASDPPDSLVAAHKLLAEQEKSTGSRLMRRNPNRLDIDFYIHVIESHAKQGEIKDDLVQQQIGIIEDRFIKYNIFFHFKGIDHTVNDNWALSNDDALGRGKALRKGDYQTLNLYITTSVDDENLGICTFPRNSDFIPGVDSKSVVGGDEQSGDSSNYFFEDGCHIGGYTLPGEEFGGEDMKGLTAVHEIGHWLGLFHTFQGDNCAGPGDLIQDTRVQANQSRGCPVGRISCPNATFQATPEDPIHNYMDYSDDDCATEFTILQMVRVFGVWPIFRVANDRNVSTTGSYRPSTSANTTSSTSGNYSLPSMNSAKTTFLPSKSGILPEPSGKVGPPGSVFDQSAGPLPASGPGNPLGPFATSGPAVSVNSDPVGESVEAVGLSPDSGPGATVGSVSIGEAGESVGSPTEGGQDDFGQGNALPNLGSVTIQCPNGNLFATGSAGSCVINVVTITTLSCSQSNFVKKG